MVTLIGNDTDELASREQRALLQQQNNAERYGKQGQRHPEKAARADTNILRKPSWIRVKSPGSAQYLKTKAIVEEENLSTVCAEAGCPNIAECWSKSHATFLVMGSICTRACAFCNIATGLPLPLDAGEPARVADAVHKLALKHVVITSVDRDDLPDGGATHLAKVVDAIRSRENHQGTIEVLTPDFRRKDGALEALMQSSLDVFNHNLETTPSLYPTIRPGARYYHSLRLLERAKEITPTIFTKSGVMVGLGESYGEVLQVMDDLRCANVDFITIGQYLQPTRKHAALKRYVEPAEFESMKEAAYGKGFLMVSSSPLTRSSYHADDDFYKLRARRQAHVQSSEMLVS